MNKLFLCNAINSNRQDDIGKPYMIITAALESLNVQNEYERF